MRIFFFGGKAQARLNHTILHRQGHSVPFVFDSDPAVAAPWDSVTFSDPDLIEARARQCDGFVVCVANETRGRFRVETSRMLEGFGLEPVSVIHPESFFGDGVVLGKGLQTYPRCCIHDGTVVGDYCIVGLNAAIDHDCRLGHGVTVMNSAAIIGHCNIGDYAAIGTNATLLPYVSVGSGVIIPPGALVEADIPPRPDR